MSGSRPGSMSPIGQRRHLLTVGLEDYFQVGAFNRLIQRGQWYRFETRVLRGARATLDLLDEFGVTATFFTSGWIAERAPEVVREVAERGHEVASSGFHHRRIRDLTRAEFRDDLARARTALQAASGQPIHGYRVPRGWFRPEDLWALDVLAEEGYAYDSSVGCLFRRYAREPWRRVAHHHQFGGRSLWEFPPSAMTWGGWFLPIAGGNYFRQLPDPLIRSAVARWDRSESAPFVMYFHTWEMDLEQPQITGAPLFQRIRQYRNLHRMPDLVRAYLGRYQFQSIARHLGLSLDEQVPAAARPTATPVVAALPPRRTDRVPVSVVIPCYNEELVLPYLRNTLASVETELADDYDVSFVFVDDASRDDTFAALERNFGERDNVTIVRHPENQGVAAAILSGLRASDAGVACSIDCDCTYDPHELTRMIPLLEPGVDLVTASPYHPRGSVRNVPRWRLALSRSLSWLYRRVLRQKLHTYTSCFRVYRRASVASLELANGGFLGVAETLGRLDLQGRRIVEFPTTLEVRVLGHSKMKVVRTIGGHLVLLARLLRLRLRSPRSNPGGPAAPTPTMRAA